MKKRSGYIIGFGLTFFYLIIQLILMKDYGLSWDFHYHNYAGLYHLGLSVPSIQSQPSVPFTSPDPRLTIEDPFGPFTQIIPTISYVLFYERWHILPLDVAYNLPIVIIGSLGVGLLYFFVLEALGWEVAMISAVFLGALPSYFAYLHTNMKDVPNAFGFALSIYFFWRLFRLRRLKDLALAALSFAYAFNVKINSVVIPVILFCWVGILAAVKVVLNGKHRWARKGIVEIWGNKRVRILLVYFLLAPVAAIAVWWPFWKDPIGKLSELPYFYSHNTIDIPVLLLGTIYHSGRDIPWFYPYIYIAITTPPIILFSLVTGLGITLVRGLTGTKREFYLLLLLWFFVPLLRYLSPTSGAIDGVRHFMEVVYPLVVVAAIGAWFIYRQIRKFNRFLGFCSLTASLVFLCSNLFIYHPYQASYFNFLTGGIKGAQGKFDIDFWGTPQREAMLWLNQHAPYGASIYVAMAQSSAGVYLRDDLRVRENSKSVWESDFGVILNRQSFLNNDFGLYKNVKINEGKVVYTRKIDGISLVWVFQK